MVSEVRRSTRASTRAMAPEVVKKAATAEPATAEDEGGSEGSALSSPRGKRQLTTRSDDASDFEDEMGGVTRSGPRRSKRSKTSTPTVPSPKAKGGPRFSPNRGSAEEEEENEEEGSGFVTRSMAAGTAKRCCALDSEGRVDLCVKILAKACGLDPSSAHMLCETKSVSRRDDDGDDEDLNLLDENEEDKDEGEVYAEFARSLSERFGEEGSSAGLSDSKSMLYAKTVTAKKRSLEANFVHFWNQLVVLLHGKETLYARGSAAAAGESADGSGVDFLSCMARVCVELSKSEVRQVRYASCVCGYALLGSLVHAHQILDDSSTVLTRQLRAAQGNTSAKKDRRRDLNRRMQECHDRSNELDEHMKDLFQELVIVRFRDVSPQIRALTVRWVGVWVTQHPKRFLSDAYLKYVAWSLNDKDAQGRLAAVQALGRVYQKHAASAASEEGEDVSEFSNISALDLLTQRFSSRFLELVKDVNEHVCVGAMDLVLSLADASLLDLADADQCGALRQDLAMLLLDGNVKIRKAAGRLAARVVESSLEGALVQPAAGKRGKTKGKGKAGEPSSEEKVSACVMACKALGSILEEGSAKLSKAVKRQNAGAQSEEELRVRAVMAVVPCLGQLHDWDVLAKACRSKDLGGDSGLLCVVRVALACVQCFSDPKPAKEFLLSRKEKGRKVMASAVKDFCDRSVQGYTMAFTAVLKGLFNQCKSKKGHMAVSLVCLLCKCATHVQQELYVATGRVADYETIVSVMQELWGRDSLYPASSRRSSSSTKDEEDDLDRCGHLAPIAACLAELESAGPGATREPAQRALVDMIASLKESISPGLGSLEQGKAAVAMARISALRPKLLEDPAQRESVLELLQDFLAASRAEEMEEEEEEGGDAMEESGTEDEEDEAPPPPPRRTRRRS